jgi:hypothetical protein
LGNLLKRGHIEDQEEDGKITLRRIIEVDINDSGTCPLARYGINDVEPSGSVCNQSVSILRGISAHEGAEGGGIGYEEVTINTRTCSKIRCRRINKA